MHVHRLLHRLAMASRGKWSAWTTREVLQGLRSTTGPAAGAVSSAVTWHRALVVGAWTTRLVVAVLGLSLLACGADDRRPALPAWTGAAPPPFDSPLWKPVRQGSVDATTEGQIAVVVDSVPPCERFLVFPTGDRAPGSTSSRSIGSAGCVAAGAKRVPPLEHACQLLAGSTGEAADRWPSTRHRLAHEPCARASS